ncbi:MAG: DUF1365 domain-containing protein [Thermoleophilaceae bacterium]|nr:DUF1365 domain-containing protein [Thermoleophilaceae bacterium]
MTASAIYRGTVTHKRLRPQPHGFSYPVHMFYLDLDELPSLFARSWLWSAKRPALAWFRRSDYYGNSDVELATSIRDLVEERSGTRPDGPIRLLTNVRTFGYCFNPISVYYCFATDGKSLTHVVTDVTSIPWHESHAYVFPAKDGEAGQVSGEATKQLHVSPFLGMDYTYSMRAVNPEQRLSLRVANASASGELDLVAQLELQRRVATNRQLRSVLLRQPLMAASITARIFGQALRMRFKGFRVHPHPVASADS